MHNPAVPNVSAPDQERGPKLNFTRTSIISNHASPSIPKRGMALVKIDEAINLPFHITFRATFPYRDIL